MDQSREYNTETIDTDTIYSALLYNLTSTAQGVSGLFWASKWQLAGAEVSLIGLLLAYQYIVFIYTFNQLVEFHRFHVYIIDKTFAHCKSVVKCKNGIIKKLNALVYTITETCIANNRFKCYVRELIEQIYTNYISRQHFKTIGKLC